MIPYLARRVALAVPLLIGIATVIFLMIHLIPGDPLSRILPMRARMLVEFLLASPVCLWAAWPFYVRAVASVANRRLNMFTLIGLGVSVSYLYSVVAALLPGLFPASFRALSAAAAALDSSNARFLAASSATACSRSRSRSWLLRRASRHSSTMFAG